jgi:hypothetical protein
MQESERREVEKPVEPHSQTDEEIGAYLRTQREGRRLTVQTVAAAAELTVRALELIEAGADCLPAERLRDLAPAYQLGVVELFLAAGLLEPEDLAAYQASAT